MIYSKSKNYTLYLGKMEDELSNIDDNSIGSIVTDPPYELGFMGKSWDSSGVAFQKSTWEHCYRILKPGGYLLAFGGSRTYHRIACAIEDAGFEIRDTIMWLYGSGFPKSMDISKQLDKRNGKQNEDFTKFGNYVKQCREAKGYSKNDIDKIMGTNTAYAWWEGRIYKDDFIVQLPDKENYYKLKEILDMNNDFDYLIEWQEAERKVIGQKEKLESYQYKNNNVYQTNGDKEKITLDITIPSTDLAKQWQGWGTALKPSFEPIIVARKPFKGSLVDNVIEYGVGGINIDECRVETTDTWYRREQETTTAVEYQRKNKSMYAQKSEGKMNDGGRFPANTILTYDETNFDEVCGGFPESKGSISQNVYTKTPKYYGNALLESSTERFPYQEGYNDNGSASRYFYCAKASKKDRDEGLEEFEDKQKYYCDGRGNSLEIFGKTDGGRKPLKNIHPTVKPTSLMQYLIRLVTPKGETVLDPFMGSGSTGKAVMFENNERDANYKFIGVEMTEEYLPICKKRIEFAQGYVSIDEIDDKKVDKKVEKTPTCVKESLW